MLSLANITFFLGNRCIFSNLNLQANKGDRIGLIGPNGAGKTTLLRLIAGVHQPEEGSVSLQSNASIGYLEQEVLELNMDRTVLDVALLAFEEANRIEHRLEEIFKALENTTDYESEAYHDLLDEMQHLQDRYHVLEGDKKESKTATVLEGLGFTTEQLYQPLSRFSGGWRMRVLLAKLLLEHPDVLLLDEPTNHLDIDSIEWLEEYLRLYDGAVILVSHDRFFLDRMVNQIADLRSRRLFLYPGNYERFLELKAEQMELQSKTFDAQQKQIAETERFIERFRAKATKAKQVQSRVKQLDKIDRVEAPDSDAPEVSFRFPDPPRSGKVVLTIENLVKKYPSPDAGAPEIQVFNSAQSMHIEAGDKIALIGPNGAGKSTLARILDGIEPFEGKRKLGHNVVLSYFAQHLADVLSSGKSILDVMDEAAPNSEARSGIRTLLGCFLFTGDDVFKPIKVLSGGERSRVALARTLLTPANVLVLDEPTNHLDLASKNVLVQALKDFKGTLIVVSHDRYFLQGFATKIWRVGGGKVTEYDGGYDYYEWKSKQLDQQEIEKSKVGIAGKANPVKSANNNPDTQQKTSPGDSDSSGSNTKSKDQKRHEADLRNELNKAVKPLKNQASKLESEISSLEKEKDELEKLLADPSFYEKPESADKIKRFGLLQSEIDSKTELWLEVLEKIEETEKQLII
ncbi:MAG TPA: ABC transporter ATP-binding protein [Bacteroidetes bacterium]|nr:ABC transporter ATP-binding protein [Bacteroidota bacterium]